MSCKFPAAQSRPGRERIVPDMKKRLLSLLLSLLLLLGAAGTAQAENTIIVNLGTAEAGVEVDRLLCTTERGTAAISAGVLPEGCRITTEEREDGACHYLRGTPLYAGDYAFTLLVSAPAGEDEIELLDELQCSLTVLPATPTASVSGDVQVGVGEETAISVTASTPDGGTLSYQWYVGASRGDQNGSPLPDGTGATLALTPSAAGTSFYYCVVTNTNNGRTASCTTASVAVTAEEVRPVSLTLLTLPTRLEYTQDEALDTAGLQLLLTYSNGRSETIGAGFTAEPSRLRSVGSQAVTVGYAGLTCTYSVQVKEPEEVVLDLQIVDLPERLDYQVGEWVDTTGMTLRVDTNRGSYDVSTGYSVNPRALEKEGRQTITVSYDGQTASFAVNVVGAEKRVESITVLRRPVKLSYREGDSFDPLGLTLMVQTNQGSEEISEGFTWTPQTFTDPGRQDVTISYEGQTCTLSLIVGFAEETAAPQESAEPTPEPEPSPEATPRPNVTVERKSGRTAVVVIVVAAIVGLASLLGYLYLTKKERMLALWQKLCEKLRRGKK